MARIYLSIALLIIFLTNGFSENDVLRSGPMLGYSTMKEVGIWLQLKKAAEVKVQYWSKTDITDKRETEVITTSSQNEYIAQIIAKVDPGKLYEYKLIVDGKELEFEYPLEFQSQSIWQYRTDPPDFKMALGSCVYINEPDVDRPGEPYGGNYEIFNSINEKNPDLMLWLGDNNYLREVDWDSRTGIYHRYAHSRDVKEMQPLLAKTHNYAIWDDHDYGPNNSDASYWNKKITEEAFKDFWMNPNYNMTGNGGITGTFFWSDCQFFLLDNRYFRTANNRKTSEKIILGNDQIEWLINALKASNSRFKFILIGGQFISNAAIYENHQRLAPEEREKLIDLISEEEIKGVIFLSGDRHHTELSKLERENKYPIYDWTVSPLTSKAHETKDEGNSLVVPGSTFGVRSFGTIDVSGPYKDRILNLKLFDSNGKELWNYQIKATDLD